MNSHNGHDTATDDREAALQRPAQRPRRRRAHEHQEVDARRHARTHYPREHYQE